VGVVRRLLLAALVAAAGAAGCAATPDACDQAIARFESAENVVEIQRGIGYVEAAKVEAANRAWDLVAENCPPDRVP
jgi:predicted outer membrane protein